MNKKFISSVLAGACALSMTSIAAFADVTLPADSTAVASDWGTDGNFVQPIEVSSSIQTPTLKVTVPTTAAVLVNPYKIAVTVAGGTIDDTIISPEYSVKNESNCAVAVTVTASAKVKDTTNKEVSIATKPLTGTETKKTAFMYVESTETQGTYCADGFIAKAVATKGLTGDALDAANTTNAYMAKQMALTTKDTSKVLMTLKAGDTTATENWFKIQGEAASNTATPWAAKDAIDVGLTLKISPAANGSGEGGNGGGGAGFTASVAAADISFTGTAATLGALTANDTYAIAYDGNVGGNVTPAFDGYSITNVTGATAGITVNAAGRFSCSADGTYTISYELENDSNNTDTPTITFVITASDC